MILMFIESRQELCRILASITKTEPSSRNHVPLEEMVQTNMAERC